jgi:hypothetical protein
MEQPSQREIVMVHSDSDGPAHTGPGVSSEELDGGPTLPDPDDSGVVQAVSGKGFQIIEPLEDEATT